MKENTIKNFWYLTGISLIFAVIALLTSSVAEWAYRSLDTEINSAGAAVLFLFPVYMIKGLAIAFIDVFVCRFTLIASSAVFLSALIARFPFNPENGHFKGFKFFTVLGYTIAKITAVLLSIALSLAVPCGILMALPLLIGFFAFCKKEINAVADIKSSDKLSHFTELAYNCDTPAILCDTDFTIYCSNSFADSLYKSYDSPEIMGRCFCDLLSDEEARKLRGCAETLSENSSFDRLFVTYTDENKPDLTVTAVRFKNRRLVGFLIKHE